MIILEVMNMNLNINWNKDSYQEFIKYLKSISDAKTQVFNTKIITTKYPILGIKLPLLRNIAKKISAGDYQSFIKHNTSTYYEEVMINLLVISNIKDKDELLKYFYIGLDLIDNWALCDSFCSSLKIVNKYKHEFLDIIKKLVKSNKTYYIRVGIVLLLDYYIEEEYLKIIFNILDNIKSCEYYVLMAISWLVAEIFIKYPEDGLNYLKNNNLNSFTINKSISKIRDSYRVKKEVKEAILQYKR